MKLYILLAFVWLSTTVVSYGQTPRTMPIEKGVAQTLAQARQKTISQLQYALRFEVPARKSDPIPATETIRFTWKKNADLLQLDFKETPDHLHHISVNGKVIPTIFRDEHILIDPAFLKAGANAVTIQFTAGDLSLNRNDDYLYTLLVPDRARTVFPCFDQPDLKASFQLTLSLPKAWLAMTNGAVRDSVISGARKTMTFEPSEVISTYLFAFVAGKFTPVTRRPDGRPMTLFHRETDSTKIRLSMGPIFTLHADALGFLEDYTALPYPFRKFDFAAIPDFQYGGMEHAGAIDYKLASLFLDGGATRDQLLSRATLIAHETAHMWFGDLVTMRWFDDVWLKEVFANFMADKITENALPGTNYDLQFVVDHLPAAYAVDRTEGANPIGQPLANLQEAGSLYGGIIYHKAPIMMRQLERIMGKTALRDGLRTYLKTYAFGNATWTDLIKILDARTPTDLQAWNHVWVRETGRPVIDYQLQKQAGKISRFVVTQRGEDGSSRQWPQEFDVALVYPDHVDELTVAMNGAEVNLTNAIGKAAPLFVVFNASGQGYGRFPVDTAMLTRLGTLPNPVMRASAYINLYENMLAGQAVTPAQLAAIELPLLATETEELNLRLLTGHLGNIVWSFTLPDARPALARSVELAAGQAMGNAQKAGVRKLLFRLYQRVALSKEAQELLYGIWSRQQPPPGVTLTEDDYTSLAQALAVRDFPVEGILQQQLTRIKNPDRRKRLQFVLPALSGEATARDAFFASLAIPANREHEAWVTEALGYLHHPLRAATSVRYIPESLEMLEEIQRMGDIFFPASWLQATLGAYQTPDVSKEVRRFLMERPAYNARLREKLLQAADTPFRASKLLY